jgi:hypothetical protein
LFVEVFICDMALKSTRYDHCPDWTQRTLSQELDCPTRRTASAMAWSYHDSDGVVTA